MAKVKVIFDPSNPQSVSRTAQHFKKECDINNIVAKFEKTGILGNPLRMQGRVPFYGDFSNIPDYTEAFNKVQRALDGFKRLPSAIKIRFNHNPQELLDFVNNPANLAEACDLGLLPKELKPKDEKPAAGASPVAPASPASPAAPAV